LSAGASPQTPLGELTAPDPTGGAYSAPPDSLAGLRGPTTEGRRGEERGGGGEGRGRGREMEGGERDPRENLTNQHWKGGKGEGGEEREGECAPPMFISAP